MMKAETQKLVIIDYGMGNLRSVSKAWQHEGGCARIVDEPREVGQAEALVLPGVGAFGDGMAALQHQGWDRFIPGWINEGRPFFGICLGLQLLFAYSEESAVAGLGVFPGKVKRFSRDTSLKVPHMGWNTIHFRQTTPLNAGLREDGEAFYFVHSYYVEPEEDALIWCDTDYGKHFVSGIARGSCFATQFHPEKSQAKGLCLYRNFITMLSGKEAIPRTDYADKGA